MGRRWKQLAALVAAVAVVAGVVAFADARRQAYRFRVAPAMVNPRPFEAQGWASGSATLRHEMARHLLACGELAGRSRTEMVNLLGPPMGAGDPCVLEWHLGERQEPTGWMWNYDEYLRVDLDGRGLCGKAVIWSKD